MPANPHLLVSAAQRQGGYYEQIALDYLQRQGLQLIAQNWQQPKVGEIDLIMRQSGRCWDILVLVEVRQRNLGAFGDALLSVTPSKQRKLINTARYFLQQHPKYANFECRFDVVGFDGGAKLSQGRGKQNDTKGDKEAAVERAAGTNQDKKAPILSRVDLPTPHWIQGAFIASAW